MLNGAPQQTDNHFLRLPIRWEAFTQNPQPHLQFAARKNLQGKHAVYALSDQIVLLGLMRDKGLALDDVLRGVHKMVLETQFPGKMKALIVEEISEIEYKLSFGGIEKIQVAAFVAAFINCRTVLDDS